MNRCIVCGHSISHELFNPGPQPLAALGLPRTEEEALNSVRYPMEFRSCDICGHVWNVGFEYAKVPYAGDTNLMYNKGDLWKDHMQVLIDKLAENKAMWIESPIIDIGCGDGLFFLQLLKTIPDAKCIGFEPGIEGDKITEFQCIRDYFIPSRDIKKYKPSLLVCRHVIEHLENPRDFIAEIAHWCMQYAITPVFLAEVPCFEKALNTGRLSDFLYEHVSNFTLNSLYTLFSTSGFQLLEISRLYGDEVTVGFFQPHNVALMNHTCGSIKFNSEVKTVLENVKDALDKLPGTPILWGGTGRSAAFINIFGLTKDKFPLVVDSDNQKVGLYVPGTGQKICSPEHIVGDPVIIITTAWRAKDIYNEIIARKINYSKLLVLTEGNLNEYTGL